VSNNIKGSNYTPDVFPGKAPWGFRCSRKDSVAEGVADICTVCVRGKDLSTSNILCYKILLL
jgi:hypothetical protein